MNSNELQVFHNDEFGEVRTLTIDREPWFIGRDITAVLGYKNPNDAMSRHVDKEDKGVAKHDTLGGTQNITIINESGLYSLILSSKLPKAKQFKRWVTSEVLPSIRKHGMYATDELLNNPDLAIKAFQALKFEREKSRRLKEKIEQDKPKVLFSDAVAASKTSILVGELAKLLKQNGVDIGAKRLFQFLRDNGYLMKTGSAKNMPTQYSMNNGWFDIKISTLSNPDGSVIETKTTKVTGKGQQYFVNLFLAKEKKNES